MSLVDVGDYALVAPRASRNADLKNHLRVLGSNAQVAGYDRGPTPACRPMIKKPLPGPMQRVWTVSATNTNSCARTCAVCWGRRRIHRCLNRRRNCRGSCSVRSFGECPDAAATLDVQQGFSSRDAQNAFTYSGITSRHTTTMDTFTTHCHCSTASLGL